MPFFCLFLTCMQGKNNLIYILWQYPCKTLSYDINDLEKNLPHVKNSFSYEYACVCISDLFLPLSEVGIIRYLKENRSTWT